MKDVAKDAVVDDAVLGVVRFPKTFHITIVEL